MTLAHNHEKARRIAQGISQRREGLPSKKDRPVAAVPVTLRYITGKARHRAERYLKRLGRQVEKERAAA